MECPICWDSLVSASTPTVSIPCGHLFHEKCLHPYMVQRAETGLPDCPTCREPIKLITGHDLARIPRELHELCHTAVRRVYVAARGTDADDTAKELDYLYARVAQLQDGVQHAREKEESAEGRIAAIMGLWKTEQVRVAELQRRLQQAVLAQQNTQGLKPELRPSAPSPRTRASADGPDQWRQLEDQMLMQAAAQLSTAWGPPPPPAAQRAWGYQGQPAPPQSAGAEMHAASPPASVAVVTHPYQPVLPSGGSPSGSVPPPPPPPQMQMMHAVPHPYASPSPAAPPEMPAAPYGAAAPQAYAQASGSGASSRTRHLAGFARERALENARLQQQQRWAQNQRVLAAYRQQHDAALAHARQHPPQQHSYQQAAPPRQPWPST